MLIPLEGSPIPCFQQMDHRQPALLSYFLVKMVWPRTHPCSVPRSIIPAIPIPLLEEEHLKVALGGWGQEAAKAAAYQQQAQEDDWYQGTGAHGNLLGTQQRVWWPSQQDIGAHVTLSSLQRKAPNTAIGGKPERAIRPDRYVTRSTFSVGQEKLGDAAIHRDAAKLGPNLSVNQSA
jgi:hypothetical protein